MIIIHTNTFEFHRGKELTQRKLLLAVYLPIPVVFWITRVESSRLEWF